MTKYHIKRDGTPGVCHAVKGHCPLGGADNHFTTQEAAQQAADERNANESNLFNKQRMFSDDKTAQDYFLENNRGQVYGLQVGDKMFESGIEVTGKHDLLVVAGDGYALIPYSKITGIKELDFDEMKGDNNTDKKDYYPKVAISTGTSYVKHVGHIYRSDDDTITLSGKNGKRDTISKWDITDVESAQNDKK